MGSRTPNTIVFLLASTLCVLALAGAARVSSRDRDSNHVEADIAAAALEAITAPTAEEPVTPSSDNTVNSKNSDLADDGNAGGLSRRLTDKKSHVTVIANTNKLFQVETEDGRTISQTREGGETVDGKMEESLRKDLDERREKRERKDRDESRRNALLESQRAAGDNEAANDGFDLGSMCALAAQQCPLNWEYRGTAGLLFTDDNYDKFNPFKSQEAGANPDVGYKWTHPNLCCATNIRADVKGLYALSKSCPDGNTDRLGGVTYLTAKYSENPYQVEEGHDYNKFWKWIHPYICMMTEGNADFKTKHRSCLLARRCQGEFKDFGFTGLLIRTSDVDKQPFQASDESEFKEYPGWRWIHPKLCCNPDGE